MGSFGRKIPGDIPIPAEGLVPPVLALDVGGTHLRGAVVDRAGSILTQVKIKSELSKTDFDTPQQAEYHVLRVLSECLQNLKEKHPESRAAGIGFPGFFRGGTGIVEASPNIPQLHEFDLAGALSGQLGISVSAQNDALLAALGEFRFGVGKGLSQLIHVTLGTGVGGGAILSNAPYSGDGGMAMEIGHLRVEPQDSKSARMCGCGNRGCLETYASATAVAARFMEASGHQVNDARQVYELATGGDATARRILEESGDYLGRALAEAVKLLDIRNISISGGLASAWDILHPAMASSLEHELIPPLRGRVRIHRSTLGDNAGLLGAATLAMKALPTAVS